METNLKEALVKSEIVNARTYDDSYLKHFGTYWGAAELGWFTQGVVRGAREFSKDTEVKYIGSDGFTDCTALFLFGQDNSITAIHVDPEGFIYDFDEKLEEVVGSHGLKQYAVFGINPNYVNRIDLIISNNYSVQAPILSEVHKVDAGIDGRMSVVYDLDLHQVNIVTSQENGALIDTYQLG